MSSKAKARRQKRRAHAQASSVKQRTPGQTTARLELLDLADRHAHVLGVVDLHAGKGEFHARMRVDTTNIDRVASGLPIADTFEDIELWFGDDYPNQPPLALVAHDRFLGHPHVLVSRLLCIYLDTDREWHPALGVAGVVERLIEWLRDAAADRFDRRAALYHPIGGLPPSPQIGGTLVVRHPSSIARDGLISRAAIGSRSSHRSDLMRWNRRTDHDPRSTADALVLHTRKGMPFGLVHAETLGDLLARTEHADGPRATDSLAAAARLLPRLGDNPLRIVVVVAHPSDSHLSYIASAVARSSIPPAAAQGPRIYDHLSQLPIGWTAVSDERPEVATRRDDRRPTAAFKGKCVELWGCGGLGSWMAEFIARAGARRIVLRDRGGVSGGLLVRQNYLEDDVGLPKADQLAVRLRGIADDLVVEAASSNALDALADGYTSDASLLIDATINVTVAARLDEWKRAATGPPFLAQVATDPRTATLGVLVVAAPDATVGPATIDDATWAAICDDPSRERFHGFWTPPTKADQLVPALGCSTPTFHGSAADLASLAGSLVSLLGGHIGTNESGTHLIQSSHAGGPAGSGHHYVPFAPFQSEMPMQIDS